MSKALIKSNKHLKAATTRIALLEKNIRSSSAVEGIHVVRDARTGRYIQKKTSPKSTVTDSATKSSQSRR